MHQTNTKDARVFPLRENDFRKHDVCEGGGTTALPLLEKDDANLREETRLLGAEGKALGRDFIMRLLKSEVKTSQVQRRSLWSDNGMVGLFGIYALPEELSPSSSTAGSMQFPST